MATEIGRETFVNTLNRFKKILQIQWKLRIFQRRNLNSDIEAINLPLFEVGF